MENHIHVSHMKTRQIPYLCSLCQYKCLSDKYFMTNYNSKRHVDTVKEGIKDCNKDVFGDADYVKLEQKESSATGLQGMVETRASSNPLAGLLILPPE